MIWLAILGIGIFCFLIYILMDAIEKKKSSN